MTFEEWLDGQPFRGVLFDGTIKMMHKAWDAALVQPTTVIVDDVVAGDEPSPYRMRGDIYD